ncbi:MAG: hypothetical protein ACE5LU_10570, partial [Anaerolineae bacterium]
MMQVTICGGGNAAHALAGLIAAREDCTVNVYAPYAGEAQSLREGIATRGGIAAITPKGTVFGRPSHVSADPAAVLPGSRLVLLAVPAFAHEIILREIAPHLDDGAWIGALPARGGFDWCIEDILCRGALRPRSGQAGERRSFCERETGRQGDKVTFTFVKGLQPTVRLVSPSPCLLVTSAPPHLCISAFFGLQTLPWACRIRQYGQEVA